MRKRVDGGLLASGFVIVVSACSTPSVDEGAILLPLGTPVKISVVEELRVGVVQGDPLQEFDGVTTPFLMTDGRLVVPLMGPNEVRVFSADGKHLVTLGREGEGPGEFRLLSAAWPRGDTIEVFDGGLHRITRFLPSGDVETVVLDGVRSAQAVIPMAFSDGWALYGVASVGQDGRDQMPVHSFDQDGALRGDVTHSEGMRRYSYPGGSGPTPLSPRGWFAGHGSHVYVSDGLTARILLFDLQGTHEGELTWNPTVSHSAADALKAVVDSAVARMPEERRAAGRNRLESGPVPRLPVMSGLIVDAAGFVWIRPYEPLKHSTPSGGLGRPGPGGSWRVLSPDGADVGTVQIPDDLEPIHISMSHVVGIARDEYGVESVRVHLLARTTG